MGRLSANDIIRLLDLVPLPGEGGFYRVTWSSSHTVREIRGRSCGSAIFYLLTNDPAGFSAFHVLDTDEIYHFYTGDPVELHVLHGDERHETILLGPGLERGETPQAVVPGGAVQGSRLKPGGEYALLGTTMAPSFAQEEFRLVSRAELTSRFPRERGIIELLTRE
ncbi:MAG TPA: cupin domain-containing protein [Spirochaetia bacterium]|nr:cupin domain-containing protein [Spirochaetia bacterium]